jgi:hypothetical protein
MTFNVGNLGAGLVGLNQLMESQPCLWYLNKVLQTNMYFIISINREMIENLVRDFNV